jgi:hypothetical protein
VKWWRHDLITYGSLLLVILAIGSAVIWPEPWIDLFTSHGLR